MEKKIKMPNTDDVQTTEKTLDELYQISRGYKRFNEGMHMNIRRVWDPRRVASTGTGEARRSC